MTRQKVSAKRTVEQPTWRENYDHSTLRQAQTALHEAGHALMCYVSLDECDYNWGYRETSIDPVKCASKGCAGYCHCIPASFSPSDADNDVLYSEDDEARKWKRQGLEPSYVAAATLDIAVAGASAAQLVSRHGWMSPSDKNLALEAAKCMGLRGDAAAKKTREQEASLRAELCRDRRLVPLVLIACALLERKTIDRSDSTVESIVDFAQQALADRWEDAPDLTGPVESGPQTWAVMLSVIERLLQANLHSWLQVPLRQIAACLRHDISSFYDNTSYERLTTQIFGGNLRQRHIKRYGSNIEAEQQELLARCDRLPFVSDGDL